MISRYRLFEVENGTRYFVYDFDTFEDAVEYGKKNLKDFYVEDVLNDE